MSWNGAAVAAGGYLVGTLPSTLVVARAKRSRAVLEGAGRASGETDPHILMAKHLGVGWTAAAATLDVLKAFALVLAARRWGGVADGWLAAAGVAVVLGHTYPFYAREMAGRGLAAAAGVLLLMLPLEMTICGLLIVLGGATRTTGLATTLGLASVPAVAALQGQPAELVALGVAILGLVVARRVEGIGEVVRSGIPPGRAALYRSVFDSSGPPPGRGVWDAGRRGLPGP